MSLIKPPSSVDLPLPTALPDAPRAEATTQPGGASSVRSLDTLERSRVDALEAPPATLELSPSVVQQRPVEALVLEKVFAVLDRLFADPAFVAALTALSALPRLGHIVAGLSAAATLLMYLQEWLARERHDTRLLLATLTGFAGALSGAGVLAAGLGLVRGAALLTRRRPGSARRPVTLGFHDDAALTLLLERVENFDTLWRALDDDDELDALIADVLALAGERDKLKKLPQRRHKDLERLEAIEALLGHTLQHTIARAVGLLAYETSRRAVNGQLTVGALVHLAEPETAASLTAWLTAQPEHAERSRLDVEAAVCAYNDLAKHAHLAAGDWVYLPKADECVAPPSGWPSLMPLRSDALERRRRLVELGQSVYQGRAPRLERLLAVLERMPVRPVAYDVAALALGPLET